jgi:putative flippase GtrA
MAPIGANYISTSSALIFSFFANKHFTFKSTEKNHIRQIVLFLAVTLFGLWVLQPLVIKFAQVTLQHFFGADVLLTLVAKVVATCVSLIWNYLLYDRFVFRNS